MNTTRVVVVDDHPMVRTSIRRLLERAPDIKVIGEASNGTEAIRLAEDLDPDVLLLDMEMPDIKGVEVARRLRADGASVRILALSAHDDREYILGMLSSGASGYLTKEEAPHILIDAVRGVAKGEQGWVSRRVAAQIAAWRQGKSLKKAQLTTKETHVLQQVVAGKTNSDIASALDMPEREVEEHLDDIFAKLGVSSRIGAAVRAVQDGLV
jgi:DNA-binding NarL/FixJ family response regulator